MITVKQLAGVGLSENEVKVYLAALEMGPSTAQQMARRTGLSRVTAYAMIETLTSRGLMSSVEKDKKRFFAAESPERLKSWLKKQKAALEERERELDSFLPELKALAAGAKEKPTVRFYEGLEGLETMRQDLLRFRDIPICTVLNRDDYYAVVPENLRRQHSENLARNRISGRSIFTFSQEFKPVPVSEKLWQYCQVSSKRFPFAGEVAVYDDRVALLTYKERPIGVIIYSKDIARTMQAFFDLAWEGSKNKNQGSSAA